MDLTLCGSTFFWFWFSHSDRVGLKVGLECVSFLRPFSLSLPHSTHIHLHRYTLQKPLDFSDVCCLSLSLTRLFFTDVLFFPSPLYYFHSPLHSLLFPPALPPFSTSISSHSAICAPLFILLSLTLPLHHTLQKWHRQGSSHGQGTSPHSQGPSTELIPQPHTDNLPPLHSPPPSFSITAAVRTYADTSLCLRLLRKKTWSSHLSSKLWKQELRYFLFITLQLYSIAIASKTDEQWSSRDILTERWTNEVHFSHIYRLRSQQLIRKDLSPKYWRTTFQGSTPTCGSRWRKNATFVVSWTLRVQRIQDNTSIQTVCCASSI